MLTKLKFDDSVNGYALITNDGQPFLSFSLPDEVLPQVKGTLKIHHEDMKLVNIMTGEGIVVLARVDPKWVLAVLFSAELQLGTALSRTKDVVDLLKQVPLPPPPIPIVEDELIEEVSIDETPTADISTIGNETRPEIEAPTEPSLPKVINIFHGCVVHRGSNYTEAMTLDSVLNLTMKKEYANLAVDILLIADEKMTIYKIAERLAKPVERVLDAVKWCANKGIVNVECPEEQEPGQKEIVELPLYEGKIGKAKKEHRPVLELCDGQRTLQEIAAELGIPYFNALQSILPYRGKTLRIIHTDKLSRG